MIFGLNCFFFLGGAGNALGTLYAFQNAAKLATSRYGIDISSQLKAGSISIGLYHTAGKGTRLAPLPGAENNNKVTRILKVSDLVLYDEFDHLRVHFVLSFFK